jgi:ATP-dependent Zn protease
MIQQMEQGFGSGNVRFDNATNSFIAKMVAEMIAIKDEFAKNWCFVNNDEENNLADLLFSKEVNEKLHTYK